MHLQLATISHYLGDISEYHGHCNGTEDIFRSWIDVDGHLVRCLQPLPRLPCHDLATTI